MTDSVIWSFEIDVLLPALVVYLVLLCRGVSSPLLSSHHHGREYQQQQQQQQLSQDMRLLEDTGHRCDHRIVSRPTDVFEHI